MSRDDRFDDYQICPGQLSDDDARWALYYLRVYSDHDPRATVRSDGREVPLREILDLAMGREQRVAVVDQQTAQQRAAAAYESWYRMYGDTVLAADESHTPSDTPFPSSYTAHTA